MPSSSLFLGVGAVFSTLFSPAIASTYQVQDSYTGNNWLDAFKFETYDYNNGFVNYVDETTAKAMGLYKTAGNDVMFGVDATESLDYTKMPGRKSVRLEGKKNYNHGLFVLDVKAMPGVCGMWTAFWSLGQEPWPVKGEIDIIEGVNANTVNKMVLHTDTKCKVDGLGQTAPQGSKDCALDTAGTVGCDVNDVRANSFGPGFNANNGGYYVMEWDSDAIKIWFFPRGTEPSSLLNSQPDTSLFGTPTANFKGDCDIDTRFKDQRFIFTNNFCGDWAGNVYAQSGCPMYSGLDGVASCKKYVAENPQAFANQFWRISSFKTYQKKAVSSSSSVMSSTSTSASSSSMHSSSASSTPVVSSSSSAVKSSSSSAQASSTPVSSSSSIPASSSSVYVSTSSSSVLASSSTVSVSSHVESSSIYASASSSAVAASSTPVSASSSIIYASSSSEVHVSSSIYNPSGASSLVYPSSSSAVYPISSSAAYSASSSPASVPYHGNSSTPVSYSVPAYNLSSSAPVYGDAYSTPRNGGYGGASSTPTPPKSTPYTTSSAKFSSSTPGYPAYVNSVPVYKDYPSYPVSSSVRNDYPSYPVSSSVRNEYPSYPVSSSVRNDYPSYPSYPVSSSVRNDYPYLPSFTPVTPIYPPTTSKPVYGDYNQPPVSKTTLTTTYTSTYVDVCETGYTTIKTTYTVTYCPTTTPPAQPTPGNPNNPGNPPIGWEITTKVCNSCGEGPKTVTVTVPCNNCGQNVPKTTPTPAVSTQPTCNGYDCKPNTVVTSKVYQTTIITVTKTPVLEGSKSSSAPVYGNTPNSSKPAEGPKSSAPAASKPYDAPKSTPVSSKPNVPVISTSVVSKPPTSATPGKPGSPVYGGNNGTISISIGTGVQATPSKTGYTPPVFTGAASGLQASGLVAVVAAVAAMFL